MNRARLKPQCGNCQFWKMWEKVDTMVCKRYPPAPMTFQADEPDLDGIRKSHFGSMYPPTVQNDTCGEFKERI